MICSCWLIAACTHKPYEAQTKEFKQYLADNFKITPDNTGKQIYLLVPSTQCRTCIHWDAARYPDYFLKRLYVVSLFDTAQFKHFPNLLNDPADKLLKLSFLDYANTIVLADGGNIQSIVRLRDFNLQMDSLLKSGY